MADPLSIGASVLAFVGLAERVIRAVHVCVEAVKDCPHDLQMMLCELSSMKAVFQSLTAADDPDFASTSLVRALFDKTGPVAACQRCLLGLEALLPKVEQDRPVVQRHRITLAELAWPLKQSKARKLLAEISHHKATLLLAVSGDVYHSLNDIKLQLVRLHETISDAERSKIIEWLEPTLNPSLLHNEALKKHEQKTSTWLPRTPEWRSFFDQNSESGFLWIYGVPGCGKTVLASFIVDQIRIHCNATPGSCYAYYYCHYSHKEDESIPFMQWIITQICRYTRWVPPELKELYDRGLDAKLAELEDIFEIVLDRVEALYLVLDAVDESEPREDLIALIQRLVIHKQFRKVKIVATSREYSDIRQVFLSISDSLSMSNPEVDSDIQLYVRSKLTTNHRLKRWQSMHDEIEKTLVLKAQGMFRWAECQLFALQRLHSQTQLEALLHDLPRDISETYTRIFLAIPETDRLLVRRCLIWIGGHKVFPWMTSRGISLGVLLPAIAFDLHGPQLGTGSWNVDSEYLQELCSCLVTFSTSYDGEPHSKDQSTTSGPNGEAELFATFSHYTVMEFLASPHILDTPASFFSLSADLIESEFAISVLRQALAAEAALLTPSAADWVLDREAYCLTLGNAIAYGRLCSIPVLADLFLQFLAPSRPHYGRIRAIQERIRLRSDESQAFFVKQLPFPVVNLATGKPDDTGAGILLNLALLHPGAFVSSYVLLIRRLLKTTSSRRLLDTKLSAVFLANVLDSASGRAEKGDATVTYTGTVREIYEERKGRGHSVFDGLSSLD